MINFKSKFERHEHPFVYHTIADAILAADIRRLNTDVPALELFDREIKEGTEHRKQYNMWRMSLYDNGGPTELVAKLPSAWRDLAGSLFSAEFADWASEGLDLDVRGLRLTSGLYRYSERDYTTVDTAKLDKAVHWAFYLNEEWAAEDGGALNLWSAKDDAQPAVSIVPHGGTSALFSPSRDTWHNIGTITAGGKRERLTIMMEYWKS